MLRRYSRQILLILAIVMAFMMVVLFTAQSSLNQYVDTAHRSILEQVRNALDVKIEETHNMAFQLANSSLLLPLKRASDIFSRTMLEHTLKYQNLQENYGIYNKYVNLNFTIFTHSRYVVLPSAGQDLTSFSRMFSDEGHVDGFLPESFVALLSGYNSEFAPRLRYANAVEESIEVIPYVIWTGSDAHDRSLAVVILLEAPMLDELLRQSLTSDKSVFCIVNDEGRVVASSRALTPQEQEHAVAYAGGASGEYVEGGLKLYTDTTRYSSWRCVLMSDDSEVLYALRQLLALILVISIACLAMVLFVTVLMIRKNSTMLKSLYTLFEAPDTLKKREDLYHSVSQRVQHMLDDKALLQKRMRAQESVIQEVYVNNLLKGDKSDFDDELRVLKEIGFYLPDCYYYVVIVAIPPMAEDGEGEVDVQKVKSVITETLRLFSKEIVYGNINRSEVALIIATKYDSDDLRNHAYVELLYKTVGQIVRTNFMARLRFFVGDVHAGDSAIPMSFSEARLSLLNTVAAEEMRDIVWYVRTEGLLSCYYYPPETEIQFMNAIKSGNRLVVERVVRELFDANIVQKPMDYEMTMAFLHDFYGSVLKMTVNNEAAPVQQELYQFYKQNAQELASIEFQKRFIEYIYELTDCYSRNKKSHNQQLTERIQAYLQEHHAEYDLTMYRVADEFRLSSGYLSTFFREQTGMTFSECLLRIRMERAKALLETTRMPINEIAVKVGYASANSFNRAFKKYYGVSPMQMRQ